MVTVTFPPRLSAVGAVGFNVPLSTFAQIFWANLAGLLSFAIFLSAAVARRRQPDMHKRLMLLAAISVVQPAIARLLRWPVFEGIDAASFNLVGLLSLIVALGLHDLISNKRVHPVTLLGGAFFLGSLVFSQYVLATSDLGRASVRWLIG